MSLTKIVRAMMVATAAMSFGACGGSSDDGDADQDAVSSKTHAQRVKICFQDANPATRTACLIKANDDSIAELSPDVRSTIQMVANEWRKFVRDRCSVLVKRFDPGQDPGGLKAYADECGGTTPDSSSMGEARLVVLLGTFAILPKQSQAKLKDNSTDFPTCYSAADPARFQGLQKGDAYDAIRTCIVNSVIGDAKQPGEHMGRKAAEALAASPGFNGGGKQKAAEAINDIVQREQTTGERLCKALTATIPDRVNGPVSYAQCRASLADEVYQAILIKVWPKV